MVIDAAKCAQTILYGGERG